MMATADSVKTKIQGLIARANAATNGSDINLTTAVDRLIAGFGKGGATEPYIEEIYGSSGNLVDVKMYGYTEIRNYAFYYCSRLHLTTLPEGITSIGNYAFYYCSELALTSLPEGLISIGNNAFDNCTGLTSITFKGIPTLVSSSAFKNCTNLTTINVPWAEGAVANAPWGATNATINYNYTEEA